jgi:hypothetical protein
MSHQMFVVMLRRPRKNDRRSDPFWEFGSFGCTGYHGKNLLHPKNCQIRNGDRLALVQGGKGGLRLLLVTPPVKCIKYAIGRIEVRWVPPKKSLFAIAMRHPCSPRRPGFSRCFSLVLQARRARRLMRSLRGVSMALQKTTVPLKPVYDRESSPFELTARS